MLTSAISACPLRTRDLALEKFCATSGVGFDEAEKIDAAIVTAVSREAWRCPRGSRAKATALPAAAHAPSLTRQALQSASRARHAALAFVCAAGTSSASRRSRCAQGLESRLVSYRALFGAIESYSSDCRSGKCGFALPVHARSRCTRRTPREPRASPQGSILGGPLARRAAHFSAPNPQHARLRAPKLAKTWANPPKARSLFLRPMVQRFPRNTTNRLSKHRPPVRRARKNMATEGRLAHARQDQPIRIATPQSLTK